MAKPPKFPGLQAKFERRLRVILSGESKTGREIIAAVRGGEEGFTDDELRDLQANFANYIGRAKESGLVSSGGPHAGYWLAADAVNGPEAVPFDDNEQDDAPDTIDPNRRQRKETQQWEAFMHLPMTVALTKHFEGRVLSLPTTVDRAIKWSNPDLLVLRRSSLASLMQGSTLKFGLFKAVDPTPECILTSVELKVHLERDRTKLMTAIAETAANSRWANEAWLVFVDRTTSPDEKLDPAFTSLARSTEVGLLEVRITREAPFVSLVVHHPAPLRDRLGSAELGDSRVNRPRLLESAQELLAEWEDWQQDSDYPLFYLPGDDATDKATQLLQRALKNLQAQKTFGETADALIPLRVDPDDSAYVSMVMEATVQCAADIADPPRATLDGNASALLSKIGRAAGRMMTEVDATEFRRTLQTLAPQREP